MRVETRRPYTTTLTIEAQHNTGSKLHVDCPSVRFGQKFTFHVGIDLEFFFEGRIHTDQNQGAGSNIATKCTPGHGIALYSRIKPCFQGTYLDAMHI